MRASTPNLKLARIYSLLTKFTHVKTKQFRSGYVCWSTCPNVLPEERRGQDGVWKRNPCANSTTAFHTVLVRVNFLTFSRSLTKLKLWLQDVRFCLRAGRNCSAKGKLKAPCKNHLAQSRIARCDLLVDSREKELLRNGIFSATMVELFLRLFFL